MKKLTIFLFLVFGLGGVVFANQADDWKQKCALGDGMRCNDLGLSYYFGEDVPKDYSKARKYYQRACDLNYPSGCVNLGYLHREGVGVRKDYFEALHYYQKACDLDEIECDYVEILTEMIINSGQ